MFFQARRTSGKPDRYLTTIKNSYKQGMLLGRAQEEGEEGTCSASQTPITLSKEELAFSQSAEKNKKSARSLDLHHELRCFHSAGHICFMTMSLYLSS